MSAPSPRNFIEELVEADIASGKWQGRVHTRFPPEPNGYLHIGHAKSIVVNLNLARKYAGQFNLRIDDTNPEQETQAYVDAIIRDVRWLIGERAWRLYYASDYFEQMYKWAEQLVKNGLAYVCDLHAEALRSYRGTLTVCGQPSPNRNRSPQENLELLRAMRNGDFEPGQKTLRAKIDMASGNVNLRDPVMYRIIKKAHQRQGDKWCIYPSYDWAHGSEDSIEGITHSICTLEFENHRPLYDWFLNQLSVHHPQQIEFAKLQLTYTVLSKRRLLHLVNNGHVTGWDDPRMPTLSGMRRRGYPPDAICRFAEEVGVTRNESTISLTRLENTVRTFLNKTAHRRLAVLRPLKLFLTNWPTGRVETLEIHNNPEDPSAGTRKVAFSGALYIERDDFLEAPPARFFRLSPGREVRLRGAYFIRCVRCIKDAAGQLLELHCTYDPTTKGGKAMDGRKVKSTIHWVSVAHALNAEVRLFDRLFTAEVPQDAALDLETKDLYPNSLEIVPEAKVEASLKTARSGEKFQFERLGYFCLDSADKLVFNRTVMLRDGQSSLTAGGERE